ncbi:hypothetical protein AAC387_Pa05g0426 [Persea americana]
MASSLLLHFPPLPSHLFHGFQTSSQSNSISFQTRRNPNRRFKSPISASSSSNPSSSWEREEIRWLREEQRWIREEQRWLREESRWNSDREALLREIAALKLQIEALEREKSTPPSPSPSISDAISNLASILQALKESEAKSKSEPRRIAESGSGAGRMLLEEGEVKEMVLEEIRVSESVEEVKKEEEEKKRKVALRKGSEGEDVQAMQEALQKLGFYSGEEDMEYSSFSGGTERAVKSWQASIGTREDGIMTTELLEKLFMEMGIMNADLKGNVDQKEDSVSMLGKEAGNGAVFTSLTEISEIQETVLEENGVTEVEVSQHRVFLLGENRWEEPSRLKKNKPISGSKVGDATKCLTCRGEGRLLCTECDGTGELNVEPQFLEWVDEGAKCPYCEGIGFTICDICEGRAIIQT